MINNKELIAKSFFARAPFHVVPIEAKLIWAGSGDIKKELLRIITEVRHDSLELSHLGLLYGEYGSGKTHALKYLAAYLNQDNKSLVAYLAKPKVEKKGTFQGIAKEVIQQIGRNPLKNAVEPLIEYINKESSSQVREALRTATTEQLADVQRFTGDIKAGARRELQETLCPGFPEIFNVLEGLLKDDPDAWNYFAGTAKASSLQKFELNSPIEDDHDALRALAGLYHVLTTKYPEIPDTPIYQGAYIFIDEMEQFLEMKAEEYLSIRTGLRDLFNSCTEHFCLLLAATAENASLFHGILEEAIMVRVTAEPVHLSSHDEIEDGVGFLLELMQFARNGTTPPTPEHPFTRAALEEIVNRTTEPRTARKLIQNSNRVWQKSAEVVLAGGVITDQEVGHLHGLI